METPSAVNLDHVQTFEQRLLETHVDTVCPAKMNAVCRALAVATGSSYRYGQEEFDD